MVALRRNFGKLKDVIDVPNLIELQVQSYIDFLQTGTASAKRKNIGLHAVFKEVFPISSYDEKVSLDYVQYEVGEPKMGDIECMREGQTFSAPLYVTFRLKDDKNAKEETVYMGELPLMTNRGSFVVNGAERVVVSQLHRSPGICFESSIHANGKTLYSFRIIPDRGNWLEVQFDTSDLLYIYLDRRRRRRKFLATTFLRALGFGSDEDILKLFYSIEKITLNSGLDTDAIATKVLTTDIRDQDVVVARAFEPLSKAVVKQLLDLGVKSVQVVDTKEDDTIIKSLKKDPTHNEDEALREIYRRLRPGDPPTVANAKALIKRLFFDPRRYDLGRVGRYKMNQKLSMEVDIEQRTLTNDDFVAAIKYLLKLRANIDGSIDDIDHLGSRRVRTVGELVANQCRVGLARTERLVKERMTLFDVNTEGMTPQKLINPKALSAVIRDFFGRSQLSQFMDQTNPLSEMTHKRRLSALGPGGLSRDRAGFEVRDVHPSHYGLICPIETPEGPNIGLINSLSSFARVNEFGFLEAPYRKVRNGKVTDEIEYLTADKSENYVIAQANSPLNDKSEFSEQKVSVRYKADFLEVDPSKVDYMDVSPRMLVSVAASLIPFLEHDDANRALMGSTCNAKGCLCFMGIPRSWARAWKSASPGTPVWCSSPKGRELLPQSRGIKSS
ncbi:DNA-directed RNA polymerase subunit beta [Oscillatoria amoena NRMC-F 0135]|nr:DNA-directed RNA polymerase subunit beta [Oscillatoria amoena NRMC-F 0135]